MPGNRGVFKTCQVLNTWQVSGGHLEAAGDWDLIYFIFDGA